MLDTPSAWQACTTAVDVDTVGTPRKLCIRLDMSKSPPGPRMNEMDVST